MSHYVIMKDLPGGFCEYIAEVPGMQPTQRTDMAAQIKEEDIGLFDSAYLSAEGYRIVTAADIGAQDDEDRLFKPPLPFYRPRFAKRRAGQLTVRQQGNIVPSERRE